MRFGIINSSGNVLEWFEDRAAAEAALDAMVMDAPGAAGNLDLLVFDEAGRVENARPPAITPFASPTASKHGQLVSWTWTTPFPHTVASGGVVVATFRSNDVPELADPAVNESDERVETIA